MLNTESKPVGKGCLIFVVAILIILTVSVILSDEGNLKDINKTDIKQSEWIKPNSNLMRDIAKIMIENNIFGCGEFFVSEITSNEYAVACTADGIEWTYYVVYPNLNKIYLASEKMTFESPY